MDKLYLQKSRGKQEREENKRGNKEEHKLKTSRVHQKSKLSSFRFF